jgi:hypothetical protein
VSRLRTEILRLFHSLTVVGENSHHFFFDCDKYTDNREILFNSLNWLPSNINIDVNLLTKGSDLIFITQFSLNIFLFAKYNK